MKEGLAAFDRPGLLSLIQDLYSAQKDTRTFLHARLRLGGDLLNPYRRTIARWLWPDIDEDISIAKAKEAIAAYKKATADPAGLADLMVFYCECAAEFSSDMGYRDDGYFDALCRMFEKALKTTAKLPADQRLYLIARLEKTRLVSHNLGYGVADEMDFLLGRYAAG